MSSIKGITRDLYPIIAVLTHWQVQQLSDGAETEHRDKHQSDTSTIKAAVHGKGATLVKTHHPLHLNPGCPPHRSSSLLLSLW